MNDLALRSLGQPGAPLIVTFCSSGSAPQPLRDFASNFLPGAHISAPLAPTNDVLDLEGLAYLIAADMHRADAPRVIGIGLYDGAARLLDLALARPDLFDDLVLLHPHVTEDLPEKTSLADRNVLITAGRTDPVYPAERTEALVGLLRMAGASVTAFWHGGDHRIDDSEIAAIAAFLA